jgi:hypothetical protein
MRVWQDAPVGSERTSHFPVPLCYNDKPTSAGASQARGKEEEAHCPPRGYRIRASVTLSTDEIGASSAHGISKG